MLSDLPEKVEDLRYCRLVTEQQELYRAIHAQQISQIAELLEILAMRLYAHIRFADAAQTDLRPPVAGRRRSGSASRSGKLEVFEQILEALEGDHHVVVFSQYVKMSRSARRAEPRVR